jgi:DNA repair exonuclease SbcCD ATPase subunit
LAEAAALTGLSVEALRLRIRRGKLAAERGNDGRPRVRLTTADLEEFRQSVDQQKPTLTEPESGLSSALAQVVGAVGVLRERAERAEALAEQRADELAAVRERLGRAESDATRERERADQATARAEAMAALAERRADELRQAETKLARAEGELTGLRAALARRPAWRRWLGL